MNVGGVGGFGVEGTTPFPLSRTYFFYLSQGGRGKVPRGWGRGTEGATRRGPWAGHGLENVCRTGSLEDLAVAAHVGASGRGKDETWIGICKIKNSNQDVGPLQNITCRSLSQETNHAVWGQ